MSSRPIRFTYYFTDIDDITNTQIITNQFFALSGYSIAVDSIALFKLHAQYGDMLNIGLGNVIFLENTYSDLNPTPNIIDSNNNIIQQIPMNALSTNPDNDTIVWTNPNTWGSRTKWIPIDSTNVRIIIGSQLGLPASLVTSGSYITFAFYNESTNSNEYPSTPA